MGFEEQPALLEDAGLAALIVIARLHGIATDASQLRHAAALEGHTFSETQLILSASAIGLKASAVALVPDQLGKTPFSALALDRTGRHFIRRRDAKHGARIFEAMVRLGTPNQLAGPLRRCNAA
jgi:subfamily B ATP-binding cassette protein HlyB/CyaB